jgi:hypothetical protein
LEQRCDQAVHLLRVLADRSEAFRRAAVHLRRNWTPTDPAELPLKTSLQPLFDALRAGLVDDEEWRSKREQQIAQDLSEPD